MREAEGGGEAAGPRGEVSLGNVEGGAAGSIGGVSVRGRNPGAGPTPRHGLPGCWSSCADSDILSVALRDLHRVGGVVNERSATKRSECDIACYVV